MPIEDIPRPHPAFGHGKRERPETLGYRPKGFSASLQDFHAYYMRLQEFLRNPYAAYAALRRGGLTWRIATHVLQSSYHRHEIENTEDLISHGEVLEGHADSYLSEGLTEEELDVQSKTEQRPNQVADCSWWPRHSIWMASTYNVGYWTPKCERFFQSRLQAILENKGKLKNSSEWRDALRRSRFCGVVVKKVEEASADFLTSQIST
ncbi:hypothetical protein K474DRAFT_1607687 [Panus rudis PR-1116 ss-1]|nr:hypothetical protein K474DRAFT_1607687 [Panus rudis PR-1116 ss-1]